VIGENDGSNSVMLMVVARSHRIEEEMGWIKKERRLRTYKGDFIPSSITLIKRAN